MAVQRVQADRDACRIRAVCLVGVLAVLFLLTIAGPAVAGAGPATITLLSPLPGSTVMTANPSFSIRAVDAAGIYSPSTQVKIDGLFARIKVTMSPDQKTATITAAKPPRPLATGVHVVWVGVSNNQFKSSWQQWSFTVALPPVLAPVSPTPGSTVATLGPLVSARITDTIALDLLRTWMTVDGITVPATFDQSTRLLSFPAERLMNDQSHAVSVTATNVVGGTATTSWTFNVQIYPAMPLYGYSCSACHEGMPAPNHAMTNCDGCHGPGSPLGIIVGPEEYTPESGNQHPAQWLADYMTQYKIDCSYCHELYSPPVPMHSSPLDSYHRTSRDMSSCAPCHVSDLTIEHQRYTDPAAPGGGPYTCLTCHQSTRSEVQAAIAAKNTDCFACHAGASGDAHAAAHDPDQELQTLYGSCQDAACHNLNLATEHVDLRHLSCATCHSSSSQVVQDAIIAGSGAGPQQGCAVCHAGTGGHQAQHDLVNPAAESDCAACHATNLVTEHTVNHDSNCNTCHASGNPAVLAVIDTYRSPNPLNPRCGDCHAAGTFHAAATAKHTAAESTDCQDCHLMLLPDEHARESSNSNTAGCANCHPLPVGFAWNNACADCHVEGGLAPANHGAVESVHQSTQANCAQAGCHAADVRVVHTTAGCTACHGTDSVPSTTDCESCHAADYHGDVAAKHTANEPGSLIWDGYSNWPFNSPVDALCTQCHYLSLPTEHAKASSGSLPCGTCHPLPSGFTWDQTCDACHSAGGQAPAAHSRYDAVHTPDPSYYDADCGVCHGPPVDVRAHISCGISGPYSWLDFEGILHTAYGSCHTGPDSVPWVITCRDCHPDE